MRNRFRENRSDNYQLKYVKNIWKYCSIDSVLSDEKGNEPKPTILGDSVTGDIDKLKGAGDNKDKLVSDDSNNSTQDTYKLWNNLSKFCTVGEEQKLTIS